MTARQRSRALFAGGPLLAMTILSTSPDATPVGATQSGGGRIEPVASGRRTGVLASGNQFRPDPATMQLAWRGLLWLSIGAISIGLAHVMNDVVAGQAASSPVVATTATKQWDSFMYPPPGVSTTLPNGQQPALSASQQPADIQPYFDSCLSDAARAAARGIDDTYRC